MSAYSQAPEGTYSMSILVHEVDFAEKMLWAEVQLDVTFPPNMNQGIIPLPFSSSESQLVIVPPSDYHSYFYGEIRPEERFGAILIALHGTASSMKFVFSNVAFELIKPSQIQNNYSTQLFIQKSYDLVSTEFPDGNIATLKSIQIKGDTFVGMDPPAEFESSKFDYKVLDLDTNGNPGFDVVLYFENLSSFEALYLLLGALGIVLGGLAVFGHIGSKRMALAGFIFGIVGIIGIASYYIFALTPELRLYDTTTIVTTTTALGILIVVTGRSIAFLIRTKSFHIKALWPF